MRTPKNADKVYLFVRRGIEMGTFRIGERIPTERDLADRFGLSRPTVSSCNRSQPFGLPGSQLSTTARLLTFH
ncbi:MAG: GntR family transcriptional regulator [Phycisphaerae bacterium]